MMQRNQCAQIARPARAAMLVMALLGAVSVQAQSSAPAPLRNVVQLSASGTVEVEQDWLRVQLQVAREGRDAASVQKQLQQVIDAATRAAKDKAQGQALQVRSGSFGVYPRHGEDGKIKGWQGRAELLLEGKDFARIIQTAASLQDMTVGGMDFTLSREGQEQVQGKAQEQAVQAFQRKAQQLTQQFGFKRYELREVHVSSNDHSPSPRMYRASVAAAPMPMVEADVGMAVEAGKTQVQVQISGSIELQ